MTDCQDIVRRWFALWNGDMTVLVPLVAEAVIVHAVPIGQPATGPLVGRASLGDWISTAQAMLPEVRFAVDVGPIVDGALVAVRWRASGPHGAVRIDFTGTDILRIEDGRIAEYWVNSDTGLMMQQMGGSWLGDTEEGFRGL